MSLSEIKSISIIELANRLGLEVKNKKASCYNGHDRRTASLSFNEKKGLYYCFGCGDGGDQIELVQKVLKLDFKQSCIWIGKEFNISQPINSRNYSSSKLIISRRQKNIVDNPYRADPDIYEWLIENLSLSARGIEYLIDVRGFSERVIHKLRIRDIIDVEETAFQLIQYWGKPRLIKCGLLKTLGNSNRTKLIWWDHTLIFPFFDFQGKVGYLQGRRLVKNEPKYVNLKGVEPILYNLISLKGVEDNETVYICEGITDTISAIEKEWNVIGVLGAQGFKKKWTKYFLKYEIIIVPDADMGGERFAKLITNYFKEVGIPIRQLILPRGKDLNDLINE